MSKFNFAPVTLLIFLVILLGCSSNATNPVIPQDGDATLPPEIREAIDPGKTGARESEGSRQLWGFYLIEVSEDHQSVKAIPMREVTLHYNVLGYMENGPCFNCVQITDTNFPGGGVIEYSIQLRHPFAGQNRYTGFDVRGIAIFNGDRTFPGHDLRYSRGADGDGEIMNPDGFTHLYHVATNGSGPQGLQGYIKGKLSTPQSPDATLNAYKNFYTSENRRFFLPGDAVEITYVVDPPQGGFVFGYAVDASWAEPINKPVDEIPDDFGLNANSAEAYQVSATLSEGLSESGGSANLNIWVYDWQGFDTINSVKFEAPDLFNGILNANFSSLKVDHVEYTATVNNQLLAAEGYYDFLIAVEDTANETAPEYLDLTAYQLIKAHVAPGIPNQPPVAIAEADVTEIPVGGEVNFDGTNSYDPEDGPVSLYEWDLDGDGTFETPGFPTPSKVYNSAGIYNVDLRVWDSLNATDTLDEKITITVSNDPCVGHTPEAKAVVDKADPNVGVEIHFTDISTDPDGFGDLAFFEWDLDGDDTNGPNNDGYENFSKNPIMTYFVGGDYTIRHRVTDNSNCVDVMDTPLIIQVNAPPVADAEADQVLIDIGDTVIFTSLSTDPDGNGPIVTYEWDLDGDGSYDPGVVGPVVEKTYLSPGTFNVQHRVTDSKALTDVLDTPLQITVNPPGDVVVHLSEEEAMNPIGAKYIFLNSFGSVGGTSKINYLDFDGPWDFTNVIPNGNFYQNILDKNDIAVSKFNSVWPSVQYYVEQNGPSSLDGTNTHGYGASRRTYSSPPDDGDMFTYGVADASTEQTVRLSPYNVFTWPLTKSTSQYDSFDSVIDSLGVTLASEVWVSGLGQGLAIIDIEGVPTPIQCLLLKVRQRDVWEEFSITIADTVVYRWIADDGTELAAITAVNAYGNPDNWSVASGLINGTGGIRWLQSYDLGG